MRNLHLGLYTPNQGVPKHSGSLFHSTRATTEKKKILEEEFGVAMNEELEREVLVMCNLSQGVKAEGREEGINIGEVEDLREKLQDACDHPEMVMKMKNQAADFICEKYNWDEVVRETMKLYTRK